MRDHDSLKVTSFNGLFDRGEDEVVPANFFLSCQNLDFTKRGFKTRVGSSLSLTKANLRRAKIYRIFGQAQRLLLLDNAGNLYDSTNLVTPILTIGGMTDFSVVSLFDRAYITPHDGITGLAGDKVYVYTGAGVARGAAGAAPTGFTLGLADSGISGKVEAGIHVVGVCFGTNTGFTTAPGGFKAITNAGDLKLNVTLLPIGPSYVTSRVLVMTKIIDDFNGDFQAQTYYLVPNGTISDNSTTTATIDCYDTELQADVSYLLDQMPTIPAGCAIGAYNGRLVVGGENANQSTLRASKAGQPESVDSTEGFCNINPGDSGAGIKNFFVHRDSLVVQKSQRSYFVADTGDSAVFWKPTELDMSVGAEPHSVGLILDYGQTMEDVTIVGDRKGLRVFNGTFSGILSYNIDDLWARINSAAFQTVEVVVDPVGCKIYCAVPLDAATAPSHVLVADYNDGLSEKTIRWMPWVFPVAPQSIVVDLDNTTKQPVMKYAGYTGNVYKMSSAVGTDFSTAIDHWFEMAYFPHETSKGTKEGIYHFGGVSIRIRGNGSLAITLRSQDNAKTLTAIPYSLASAPGIDIFRQFNFQAQKCAVKCRLVNANEQMICTKFSLLTKWLWSETPA